MGDSGLVGETDTFRPPTAAPRELHFSYWGALRFGPQPPTGTTMRTMAGLYRSAAVLALLASAKAQTPSVSTRVEQTSTAKAGYTTYRVMCQFDSTASEVYALFGEAGALLDIPPAFQQAAPFGTDVGPVRQLGV